MRPPSGFGDDARLKERREFRRIFSSGKKTVGHALLLWHRIDASSRPPRFGLSVSAKVGSAVRRNRLKRLLRETFRLRRLELRPGVEMVVYPRPGCSWKTRSDAERDLLDLWHKAGLLRTCDRS